MSLLALCALALSGCSRNDEAGHCDATSAAPARQAVIIGIDGLRADALTPSLTPFLFQLAQSPGVTTGTVDVSNGRTQQTFSAPGWITVLTGHWARVHGIVDNHSAGPVRVETLFEGLQDARSLLVTPWKPLYELVRGRLQNRPGLHHATLLRANDAAVEQEVLGVWRSCQPALAFIHLDAVDEAGHAGAFDVTDPGYAAAVRETDARLRRLWESALSARPVQGPMPERLVILVSDHGGLGNTHGRYSDAERLAPVLVVAPAGHSPVKVGSLVEIRQAALAFLRQP